MTFHGRVILVASYIQALDRLSQPVFARILKWRIEAASLVKAFLVDVLGSPIH